MMRASPAWLAVVSLALSTLPAPLAAKSGEGTITMQICGGGSITIALTQDPDRAPEPAPDCPKNACHAGLCRQPKPTADDTKASL